MPTANPAPQHNPGPGSSGPGSSGPASSHPGPTVFVLFGATGDLAKRQVLPAFYRLFTEGLLPRQWLLVGNGRGNLAHEDFQRHVHDALTEFGPKPEGAAWEAFAQQVRFAGGGFNSDDPGSLLDVLKQARAALGSDPQLVHYLAVPPVAFAELTQGLGQHGLARGARVVYEKPFGTSPDGFRKLDQVVHSVLDEQQVYRIDHFLGKEACQDLHLLRFANGLFAAMWSGEHVESVQIDVPEKLGITDRAGFYDATGAVLDMLVTHLFQVAAEVAMEPPASLGALDLQAARETVINCFRPLDPAEVVLGQFDGYRDVPGIAAGLDAGHVRGGAGVGRQRPLARRAVLPAHRQAAGGQRAAGQPDPPGAGRPAGGSAAGRQQRAVVLAGGQRRDRPVADRQEARARARAGQGATSIPLSDLKDADPLPPYVRLIHDVLLGDRSLFTRPDGLAAVWEVAGPLLANPPKIMSYPQGSWGPAEARELIAPGHWLLGQ